MNPEKPFFKNADQGAYKSSTLVVRQYKRQTPHQSGDQAVAVIAANYGKSMTISVEIAGGVKAQKFIIISNKCVVRRDLDVQGRLYSPIPTGTFILSCLWIHSRGKACLACPCFGKGCHLGVKPAVHAGQPGGPKGGGF